MLLADRLDKPKHHNDHSIIKYQHTRHVVMLQEIRGVHQWLAWESNVPRFQNLRGLSDGLKLWLSWGCQWRVIVVWRATNSISARDLIQTTPREVMAFTRPILKSGSGRFSSATLFRIRFLVPYGCDFDLTYKPSVLMHYLISDWLREGEGQKKGKVRVRRNGMDGARRGKDREIGECSPTT